MHNFRSRLLHLLLPIGFCQFSQAQSNYIPNIVPPSPNASTLTKYSDIPVSTYTGTADISVPIYTVQAKGISLPVSLNYHTGGIKIKEEAGWVGLGWSLAAGGAISRTILDKDDFDGTSYFTTDVPQVPGDVSVLQPLQATGAPDLGKYFFDFFCNYKVRFDNDTVDFSNAFQEGLHTYDMEPDIYSYNFAGHSGKFIITRNRKIILQKQENIRVQFESNGNSFTITDDQGNVFVFKDKEYTQSATGALVGTISSWNLTKIVTQQQDSILFNYSTDSTWTYVGPDYTETYSTFCSSTGFSRDNGAGNWYMNKTLQSIDFSTGQLRFSFDSHRSDLQDGKKLDTIKLYAKTTAGLSYVKEHDLFYSYYNYNTTSDSLEINRLRLDSVKEVSGSTAVTHMYLSTTYHKEELP